MKLSIIIPAHNEESRIEKTLRNLLEEFDKDDYEMLVICNGCTDNTFEVAKSIGRNVKVFNLAKAGKGTALIRGFKLASGDIIGFTDADGAYSPQMVRKIINEIKHNNYDCAVASRYKNKSFFSVNDPITRKVFSRLWSTITFLLFNLNFTDIQAGLKFFQGEVIKSGDFSFMCTDFSFDVELLMTLKEKGYKIKEVPVESKYVRGSSVTMGGMVEMLFSLIKLKFRRFFD